MEETLRAVGAGAGGTRNISGNSHLHLLLERELADLHGREAALVFTSGYVANDAALSTLARELPGMVVFSDASNHASMIAGIRNSRAEKHVFRHNDPADLARLLDHLAPDRPKLVCFESVYSMDGDIAPIGAIVRRRRPIRGNDLSRRGACCRALRPARRRHRRARRRHAPPDRDPGHSRQGLRHVGGYIAASAALVDFLRSHAPGFIFTTSLPPALAAGALAAIRHLKESRAERDRHQERAASLKRSLAEAGLPVMPSASHIVPVIVGDPSLCKAACDELLHRHRIYVQPINYPTVPRGTERLRLTPTPLHSDADIAALVAALSDVWARFTLRYAA